MNEQLVESASKLLLAQVGKPYKFGTEILDLNVENPPAFDCSELVEWFFWKAFGLKIPDGASNQYCVTYPVIDWMPFDLGFLRSQQTRNIHHVAIRLDKNWIVHAKGTQFGIVKQDLERWSSQKEFTGWHRHRLLEKLLA